MPELTPKLGIKKPLGNETVNRTSFNENWDIIDANVVADKGGVPSIQAGLDASKPAPGTTGRLYVATDTQIIYRDTGTAWQKVGAVKWDDIDGKPASFTPSAHKSTHASGGADAISPSDIGAAPSSHTHTKSQITDFAHKSTHASGGSDALTPADIGAVNKAGDTMTGHLTLDATTYERQIIFNTGRNTYFFGRPSDKVVGLYDASGAGTIVEFDPVNGQIRLQKPTTIQGNTVWHAGNDGAGSGLDADMVDGVHVTGSGSTGLRKITTSTSAPSGGSDGDIWIQYS